MNATERRDIAKRAVTIACTLAIIFAISGELILRAFGATADSLRVAGGILLFMIAVDMMHARISRESVTAEYIQVHGLVLNDFGWRYGEVLSVNSAPLSSAGLYLEVRKEERFLAEGFDRIWKYRS